MERATAQGRCASPACACAFQRTQLALRLEETIAARAKANIVAGGGDQKSGLQNSAKAITPIHTSEELGKLAVDHDADGQRRNPPGGTMGTRE